MSEQYMDRVATALERIAASYEQQLENTRKLVEQSQKNSFADKMREEYKEAVTQNNQFRTVIEILRQKLADKGVTDE